MLRLTACAVLSKYRPAGLKKEKFGLDYKKKGGVKSDLSERPKRGKEEEEREEGGGGVVRKGGGQEGIDRRKSALERLCLCL